MRKLILFVALCLLSLGCAAFLSAWGPSPIREMYIIERFDDPFLIILYAPFLFAVILIVSWWRKASRRAE